MTRPSQRIATLIGLLFWAAASSLSAQPPVRPSREDGLEVIHLINQERAKNGLNPLTEERRLSQAAQNQAEWMIKVGRMDHLQGDEPPRGRSYEEFKRNWSSSDWHAINRMVRVGYMPFESVYKPVTNNGQAGAEAMDGIHDLVGENVAYGSKAAPQDRFSPKRIVQGWMDSQGHRKAILSPRFKEIGVGYAVTHGAVSSSEQASAWCTVFSTPELRREGGGPPAVPTPGTGAEEIKAGSSSRSMTLRRPSAGCQHPGLDKAWADYEVAVTMAAECIRATIIRQFDAATAKGDLDAAEKWQAALEKFENAVELPAEKETKAAVSAAVADFKKAGIELAKAYEDVVKGLTMEKRIAEAKAVRAEWLSLHGAMKPSQYKE